jgi:hypothetical protein
MIVLPICTLKVSLNWYLRVIAIVHVDAQNSELKHDNVGQPGQRLITTSMPLYAVKRYRRSKRCMDLGNDCSADLHTESVAELVSPGYCYSTC